MRALVTVPGYRIEHLLSWGSQGDVFRGVDTAGTAVAMKIVTSDRCGDDLQAMERLRREARLLAAIDSPHVVKVRDFLQTEEWSALVLEYLDGKRLDAAVRARGGGEPEAVPSNGVETAKVRPPVRGTPRAPAAMQTREHVSWALDVALQLATGVAAMHRAGLIHRDLKPQNAMLVDDRVVLIDFGFARKDGVTTMTQGGTAIGTLAYMAPELLRNATANTCSDVHALGAALYHCLAGAPPIPADSTSIAVLAARRRPHDVRRANPAVDAGFAAVVTRCLEPDPRDRYPDAGAVLADLERVRRGEVPSRAFSAARSWRHHRRTIQRAAAVLAFAAMLLLGAWIVLSGDRAETSLRIVRAVAAGRVDEARDLWQAGSDEDRERLIVSLNQRTSGDAKGASAVAAALHLAVLGVGERDNHRVALLPARDTVAPPAMASEAFVPTDVPRYLLVRPGRAWCLLMSTQPQHWWSDTDPRCLQMLVDVPIATGEPIVHPIDKLPTDAPRGDAVEMEVFAAGPQQIHGDRWEVVTSGVPTAFAVATTEAPMRALQLFRYALWTRRQSRAELDFWLRHPDEPAAVADALWATQKGDPVSTDKQPARTSFWEAHRFATWYGCRLPVLVEWQVAAFDAKPGAVGMTMPRVPDPLLDVDAIEDDVTPRRIRGANSNVREWVVERRKLGGAAVFFVAPATAEFPDKTTRFISHASGPGGGDLPENPHGLRLYRSLLPVPPR